MFEEKEEEEKGKRQTRFLAGGDKQGSAGYSSSLSLATSRDSRTKTDRDAAWCGVWSGPFYQTTVKE